MLELNSVYKLAVQHIGFVHSLDAVIHTIGSEAYAQVSQKQQRDNGDGAAAGSPEMKCNLNERRASEQRMVRKDSNS